MSKILVVDAFAPTEEGRRRGEQLRRAVVEAVCAAAAPLPRAPAVELVRLGDLGAFVFDPQRSGPEQLRGLANFDGVDLVVADGDDALLPWLPGARSLTLLVHAVLVSRKCAFLAGPAMQAAAFLDATGGNVFALSRRALLARDSGRVFVFVGADGRRGVDERAPPTKLPDLAPLPGTHWALVSDAGLVRDTRARPPVVLKPQTHSRDVLCARQDTVLRVRASALGHWLLDGLAQRYVQVPRGASPWRVEAAGVRGWRVLADGADGSAQLTEHGPNAVAAQFHLCDAARVPAIASMLRSFIARSTRETVHSREGRLHLMLAHDMSLLLPRDRRVMGAVELAGLGSGETSVAESAALLSRSRRELCSSLAFGSRSEAQILTMRAPLPERTLALHQSASVAPLRPRWTNKARATLTASLERIRARVEQHNAEQRRQERARLGLTLTATATQGATASPKHLVVVRSPASVALPGTWSRAAVRAFLHPGAFVGKHQVSAQQAAPDGGVDVEALSARSGDEAS